MKLLFATLDGGGNVYPEIALARRLQDRGHTVRFLAGRAHRSDIESAGCRFAPWATAPDYDSADPVTIPVKDWIEDPETAFRGLCEHYWFGPAAAVAADVTAELQREPPDIVAVDYFMPGALAAAERMAVPSVVLWHTVFGEYPVWNLGLETFNQARASLGLSPVDDVYQQYRRARRVLVFTSRFFDFALQTDIPAIPDNVVHVGPQLVAPPATRPPKADDLPPLVVVSLSTSYQGQERALRTIVDGLGTLPVRAVVSTGRSVDIGQSVAANVRLEKWVDHSAVLSEASLMVTHAGMGTVMTTLAHGVPMLCMPMGRDQHGNAERVERLGCGLTISSDASAAQIADAVSDALADARLRCQAAERSRQLRSDLAGDLAVTEIEAAAHAQHGATIQQGDH